MVKNFFEYVKELIPEEGRSHFTLENHTTRNDLSLYQLADMLCGEKCKFADEILSYSWNVPELWKYVFPTMGIKFAKTRDGYYQELWCHFAKEAFVGAICIVAIRNGVTFDDKDHEDLRKMWERKLKGIETKEEEKYFDEFETNCMNFEDLIYMDRSDYVGRVLKKDLEIHMPKSEIEKEKERRRERDYLKEHYEHIKFGEEDNNDVIHMPKSEIEKRKKHEHTNPPETT